MASFAQLIKLTETKMMKQANFEQPFVEKYRPITLDDVVGK